MSYLRKGISRRKFLENTGVVTVASLLAGKAIGKPEDEIIDHVKIHPSIGVARIGNSDAEGEDGYFIGPETTQTNTNIKYRDDNGAIKRQAARFRVFGYDKNGNVVRELTNDPSARISWKVQLANKKSSWYRFLAALDIEEAKNMSCERRNPREGSRKNLNIEPRARSVSGRNSSVQKFDDGKFKGQTVELGEMFTDGQGRLVVLGGKGRAGSPNDAPIFDPQDADTFNNADDWFDDVSDGPVSIEVTLNGKKIDSKKISQAWLIVGPPNYAPDIVGWRTMYDLLVDTYTVFPGMTPEEIARIPENIRMEIPATTSFTNDILPMLKRLSGLQWVNKGMYDLHGKGRNKLDFEDPQLLKRLADPDQREPRRTIVKLFRLVDGSDVSNKKLQPMLYGDAFGSFDSSPKYSFMVDGLRAIHLKRWNDGEFINDFDVSNKKKTTTVESLPLDEQPDMLDKASLYFCLADAFHPGCELTWPMRHASLYSERFRIKHRVGEMKDPGDRLTIRNAKEKDGPLEAQGPGDLTKWMAVPWHGDTVFCRSGYDPEFDPFLLTYWPARVPNHVLSEEAYNKIMKDRTLSRSQKLEIFKGRDHWVGLLKGSAPDQMHQMIAEFSRMGIIEARPGIPNDPDFPSVMYVEILPVGTSREIPPPMAQTAKARTLPSKADEAAKKAGWENAEQLEEFRNIMKRRRQ